MILTEGNFYKKLFWYALPLFLSGALQLFYTAADLIICGLFGSPNATAAISSTNSLSGFVVQFSFGISLGSNALMAKAYGEGDKEKGQRITYTSMVISLILGVFFTIFGVLIAKPMLTLLNTTDAVFEDSLSYITIFFLSIPFSLIFNFGASIFRAVGDTRRPFIYLTIAGIANIILNVIFVIGFRLDVMGVAIATVISQAISATLIVIALLRYNGFFYFKIKEIKLFKKEFLEIFKVGLPAGIQNSIFSISNMLLQSGINSLGTEAVSGVGASNSIEGFVLQAMNSFGQAAMVFVSANYGAKKKDNIKKIIYISMLYVLASNILIGGLIMLLKEDLIYLYVRKQPDDIRAISIAYGVDKLRVMVLSFYLCGFMHLFGFSMRGIGHSSTPMIVTLLGVCGIRVIWMYSAFKLDLFHNVVGVALSYPISWLITSLISLLFLIIYFKKLKFDNQLEYERV